MARTSTLATASRKYAQHHAHGCLGCGRRYMDSCPRPAQNGSCFSCTTGKPMAHWDRSRMPVECCKTNAKRITDTAVLNSYSLGGPGPWFICRTCGRTHPFDPAVFSPTIQGAT